jgi:hypothetical protein
MSCPSQLRLDEWVSGRREDSVAAHLAGCERCGVRVAKLEADRAEFQRRARPQAFADAVLRGRRPSLWSWPRFVVFALAACALLFVLRPRDEAGDAYKSGGPQALLYVKRGEVVAPHDPERTLRAGDVLQLVLLSTRPGHIAVVDLEEGGLDSVLHEGPLPAGRTQLPRAFELDAWLGGERLVVLFADKAIDDPVARARRGEGRVFALKRGP